jgi:hypothetical protein
VGLDTDIKLSALSASGLRLAKYTQYATNSSHDRCQTPNPEATPSQRCVLLGYEEVGYDRHHNVGSIFLTLSAVDYQAVTLGTLLFEWAPDLFQCQDDNSICPKSSATRLIVQGVETSLSLSVVELCEALTHPDHFLYVIVTTR